MAIGENGWIIGNPDHASLIDEKAVIAGAFITALNGWKTNGLKSRQLAGGSFGKCDAIFIAQFRCAITFAPLIADAFHCRHTAGTGQFRVDEVLIKNIFDAAEISVADAALIGS